MFFFCKKIKRIKKNICFSIYINEKTNSKKHSKHKKYSKHKQSFDDGFLHKSYKKTFLHTYVIIPTPFRKGGLGG